MASYSWPTSREGSGGGILSINGDTSTAQLITGSNNISVSTAAGTTTVNGTLLAPKANPIFTGTISLSTFLSVLESSGEVQLVASDSATVPEWIGTFAGNATAGNVAGGSNEMWAGNAHGSGTGGDLILHPGTANSGTGGSIFANPGTSTSGTGGNFQIQLAGTTPGSFRVLNNLAVDVLKVTNTNVDLIGPTTLKTTGSVTVASIDDSTGNFVIGASGVGTNKLQIWSDTGGNGYLQIRTISNSHYTLWQFDGRYTAFQDYVGEVMHFDDTDHSVYVAHNLNVTGNINNTALSVSKIVLTDASKNLISSSLSASDIITQTASAENNLGALTWTAGVAPSGTITKKYRANQLGNTVHVQFNIQASIAGTAVTSVSFPLPVGLPTPTYFAETAVSDFDISGSGTLLSDITAGPTTGPTIAFLGKDGSGNPIVKIYGPSVAAVAALASFTYFTN